MVDAVGSVSSGTGGVAATASAASTATAKVSGAATSATQTATVAVEPLSPVMTADPLSGAVISQYLDSTGEVTVQVPSTAAVAYMRMGLEADGTPKNEAASNVIA